MTKILTLQIHHRNWPVRTFVSMRDIQVLGRWHENFRWVSCTLDVEDNDFGLEFGSSNELWLNYNAITFFLQLSQWQDANLGKWQPHCKIYSVKSINLEKMSCRQLKQLKLILNHQLPLQLLPSQNPPRGGSKWSYESARPGRWGCSSAFWNSEDVV